MTHTRKTLMILVAAFGLIIQSSCFSIASFRYNSSIWSYFFSTGSCVYPPLTHLSITWGAKHTDSWVWAPNLLTQNFFKKNRVFQGLNQWMNFLKDFLEDRGDSIQIIQNLVDDECWLLKRSISFHEINNQGDLGASTSERSPAHWTL